MGDEILEINNRVAATLSPTALRDFLSQPSLGLLVRARPELEGGVLLLGSPPRRAEGPAEPGQSPLSFLTGSPGKAATCSMCPRMQLRRPRRGPRCSVPQGQGAAGTGCGDELPWAGAPGLEGLFSHVPACPMGRVSPLLLSLVILEKDKGTEAAASGLWTETGTWKCQESREVLGL